MADGRAAFDRAMDRIIGLTPFAGRGNDFVVLQFDAVVHSGNSREIDRLFLAGHVILVLSDMGGGVA